MLHAFAPGGAEFNRQPPANPSESRGCCPVFHREPMHAGHVIEVRCHEDRSSSECMGCDGGIEVLEPTALLLQCRLDRAVVLAHLIRPLGARKPLADPSEPRLEEVPAP